MKRRTRLRMKIGIGVEEERVEVGFFVKREKAMVFIWWLVNSWFGALGIGRGYGRLLWDVEVLEDSKGFSSGMQPYMAWWDIVRALKQERNVCGVPETLSAPRRCDTQ